jgi:hypothetical protein
LFIAVAKTWLITSKSHSALISSGSLGINPEVNIEVDIFLLRKDFFWDK